MKPIAIIIPWYGDNIRGGAEQEANYLAHAILEAGAPVEVFTTCVKDAASDRGKNTIEPGVYEESGITVRRFPVKSQNLNAFAIPNYKLYCGEDVTLDEERIYFSEDINSPMMYKFISENRKNYKAFVFLPYLYGVTYYGTKRCRGKCILVPCFHDEGYAHMELLKRMVEGVNGIIYLSGPEKEFADKTYNISKIPAMVLGAGVDDGWEDNTDPDDFRNKFGINSPFLLYAGRKDPGKKADELIQFFIRFKQENRKSDLKLVLIGGGKLPVPVPDDLKNDVIDLGFVSIEDKHNAFAAASVFCNPSRFESFSIVIMESWLVRKPVMVSSFCPVTKNFCVETNGGFHYGCYEEFKRYLDFLINSPEIADQMGQNGYEYVKNNFSKKTIAEKYIAFIDQCIVDEDE